ncbi:helix-turn-helix domain-containing protein [Pseudotenacibaculum haliotis]|uniref:Helix-turn-helix domain-containing protein n=1 Tax=Pseudotenacibaculum haliotis TaxID=1862138 RepID=A0ABW5LU86_9FLAO
MHSQEKNLDSVYLKKASYYTNRNTDSLLHYSLLIQQSKDTCIQSDGKLREAHAYYKKGDFQTSRELISSLIDEINESSDRCLKKVKIEALNKLFWIYKNSNEFSKAFDITLEHKKAIESLNNNSPYSQRALLKNKSNMAILKMDLGFFQEARKLYLEMLPEINQIIPSLEAHDLYRGLIFKASVLNLTGTTYIRSAENKDSKSLDSALAYYKRAYKTTTLFYPPHKNSKPLYELRTAEVYLKKEAYDKTLGLIRKNERISKEMNTEQTINFLKSITFYHLKQQDSSIYYCHQFLNFDRATPSTEKNKITVLNILADQYKNLKKIDSAFKYSELAMSNLNNLSKTRTEANNSYYLYDFEKVKSLNEEILNKETSKRNLIIFILSAFVLSAILLVVKFYRRGKELSKIQESGSKKQAVANKKPYSIDKALEEKVLKALEELESSTEYLDSEFSIQVLAKQLDTNTSYLSSIINKKKKKTFKQYIGELRINYLISKLKSDEKFRSYTIQAMAGEIGYNNASAFTRAFKKQTGKTPSEFLRELESH